MPRFSKVQYEHMKSLFSQLVNQVIDQIGEKAPEGLTYEEKAGMIQSGEAKLLMEEVFTRGGECCYAFKQAQALFDFPGDDVRRAKRIKALKNNAEISEKLWTYFEGQLDRYVVGLEEGTDLIKKLRELDSLGKAALVKFVKSLPQPAEGRPKRSNKKR